MTTLPIEFLTIVYNGMPYIRWHLPQFQKLSVPWRWHIVYGLSDLVKDTGWSLGNGAYVPDIPDDGTLEYAHSLSESEPNVSLHDRTKSRWHGKTEMVNTPLPKIAWESDDNSRDCLLWQVDVDECWTAEQIENVHAAFAAKPELESMLARCWYFMGNHIVVSDINCWGNMPDQWQRVWRFRPGMRFRTHEPPMLVDGNRVIGDLDGDAAKILWQDEAERLIGRFYHFAYATEAQARFKEAYYGDKGLPQAWQRLQQHKAFPEHIHIAMRHGGPSPHCDTCEHMGCRTMAEFLSPIL